MLDPSVEPIKPPLPLFPMKSQHDRDLASAFDAQAPLFERAPVQTDPKALARLVLEADFPADSLVLDAGCGPGLVSLALLEAGHRVVGVDLSDEMVARARVRCERFGDRARFERQSIFDPPPAGPFDASISRYVLHHVADPPAFVARQVKLLGPGGVLVVSDHVTDPDASKALEHNDIERLRDRTHTRNLTLGSIVDLFASAGLGEIRLTEEAFTLDFDEWFDRGTPAASKDDVRRRLLGAGPIRGFHAVDEGDGRVTMHCWRAILRGVKPLEA
jgi:SAM-dependent methyltransferase